MARVASGRGIWALAAHARRVPAAAVVIVAAVLTAPTLVRAFIVHGVGASAAQSEGGAEVSFRFLVRGARGERRLGNAPHRARRVVRGKADDSFCRAVSVTARDRSEALAEHPTERGLVVVEPEQAEDAVVLWRAERDLLHLQDHRADRGGVEVLCSQGCTRGHRQWRREWCAGAIACVGGV